ncbi:hypothetical protein CDD81_4178 [Ophiocordyceps australis]|uniref:Major facilitator superfamily (MFS) profile domain-containing protein n=1 Tax=Ophiocordyceps australis TaxID=1399860 RepID=A0A2C5XR15_9HYPO|nr:hypothetical protein CDD81_4178 [Ophiocordyceps australis]
MKRDPRSTLHHEVGRVASQTTPLLRNDESRGTPAGKPLPTFQILLLCYARLMELIAQYSVYPYIAQMIQRNQHLRQSDVGLYSGLVESIFTVAETAVLALWCYLADHIGRKSALVFSLIGMAVGPVLFGVASSIAEMMLYRCLGGAFSGAGLIIRTMIGDHTTSETQAVAYSWFAMADNLGAFVGLIIGGALADPVTQYPNVFGNVKFFQDYPYALPGIVIGIMNSTAAITSTIFLQETLDKKTAETHNHASPDPRAATQPWGFRQLAHIPGLYVALSVYGQVMLLRALIAAVLPVALYTPVFLGGINCTPSQISLYMGSQATSQSFWFLLAFPWLQARMGTKAVLRLCSIGYPLVFMGYILMNLSLREGSHASFAWFWVFTALTAFVGPAVFISLIAAQLVINDLSPDPHLLGSLNALAMMVHNVIQIAAPIFATTMYAVGVRGQVAYGYLGWLVCIPIPLGLFLVVKWLPNSKETSCHG